VHPATVVKNQDVRVTSNLVTGPHEQRPRWVWGGSACMGGYALVLASVLQAAVDIADGGGVACMHVDLTHMGFKLISSDAGWGR
jgi:hypothetical protein